MNPHCASIPEPGRLDPWLLQAGVRSPSPQGFTPHCHPSSSAAEGHPRGFSKRNLYSYFCFSSLLFPAMQSGIREVSLPWEGGLPQQVFPSFRASCFQILPGMLQCTRRIISLEVPCPCPAHSVLKPNLSLCSVDFMFPTPSFSPFIALMGSEGDGRGTVPLALLKAARHKLFTFPTLHTVLPFIPDPF